MATVRFTFLVRARISMACSVGPCDGFASLACMSKIALNGMQMKPDAKQGTL